MRARPYAHRMHLLDRQRPLPRLRLVPPPERLVDYETHRRQSRQAAIVILIGCVVGAAVLAGIVWLMRG